MEKKRLRIVIIAHSSVHSRQQIFYETLARLGHDVLVLGPRRWHNLSLIDKSFSGDGFSYKQIGVACNNAGSLYNFKLLGLSDEIKDFNPDIIYCQQEWWSEQAWEAFCFAKKFECKFALFCWENIVKGDPDKEKLLKWDRVNKLLTGTDIIICGNSEAQEIIVPYNFNTVISPQVGIDEMLFSPPKPWNEVEVKDREIDLLYAGRDVLEKGVALLKEAANRLSLKLNIVSDASYHEMPGFYHKAKIFVSVPFTTPHWKEQSGSYTNLEAMACGLPVISTDSGAIGEYLKGCAYLIEEGKLSDLVEYITELIRDPKLCCSIGIKGRTLILNNYTNQVVAKKLMEVFNEVYWG